MSEFSKTSSAESMAIVRALGSKEANHKKRSDDDLAEKFLPWHLRKLISISWVRRLVHYIYSIKLPGGLAYIVAKSRAIDDMLRSALATGEIRQVVFLGAGYDTRAFRFHDLLGRTDCFEIDHPEIINRKIRKVETLGLKRDNIRYCAADFDKCGDQFNIRWLHNKGIDPQKTTLFIVDGVSYFISAHAFDNIIEVILQSIGFFCMYDVEEAIGWCAGAIRRG